jgi:hypothetical protein
LKITACARWQYRVFPVWLEANTRRGKHLASRTLVIAGRQCKLEGAGNTEIEFQQIAVCRFAISHLSLFPG